MGNVSLSVAKHSGYIFSGFHGIICTGRNLPYYFLKYALSGIFSFGGARMDYRIGTKQDIPIMFRIRKQQLIDEGISPESGIDKELSCCFEKKMSDGSPVEWLLV